MCKDDHKKQRSKFGVRLDPEGVAKEWRPDQLLHRGLRGHGARVQIPPQASSNAVKRSTGLPESGAIKAVSYGGGVNSTALCLGLIERGERPNYILFADTGNEFEQTYSYVETFSRFLESQGFPPITKVHRGYKRHKTLEDECLNLKTLPSLAFGFRGCSVKWKRQPMDAYLLAQSDVQASIVAGNPIERLIGIDYGEQHRGHFEATDRFIYRRPLIEWRWDRDDCKETILRHGLALPRKSSCWFCPASKKREVLELAETRPDLYARAVAMEENAKDNLQVIRGLGRHWSWKQLMEAPPLFANMPETADMDCICFDGVEEVATHPEAD